MTGHSHAEAAARSSCGWGGLLLTCNGFPPGPVGRQSGVAIRYHSNRRTMERADVQGSNAPLTDIEPSTGASRSQASEQPVVQNCSRESVKRHGAEIERHCDRCTLLEGKLVEMRDTIQRNLSEEGGCYKCPSGTNIHSAK